MSIEVKKSFENLAALYLFLDNLFDQEPSDDQLLAFLLVNLEMNHKHFHLSLQQV